MCGKQLLELWYTEVLSGGIDVCGAEQGGCGLESRELLGALYRSGGQTACQASLGEEEFRLPQKRGVPI